MSTAAIFEKLQARGSMPSPSRVALEIMRLCRDRSSSLLDIAAVIETDPALCVELLKYVNSALVSPGSSVMSIHKATVKLGMKTVMSLVLGFSVLAQNKNGVCREFDYETFWSHSLARAVAARSLTRLLTRLEADELFVCGLLSHIGALALASLFPEEYGLILSERLSRTQLLRRETDQFGIDHQALSGELFRFWGLPDHYAAAVTGCDTPPPAEISGEDESRCTAILRLAAVVAEIAMQEAPVADKVAGAEGQALSFGLEEADFANIFDQIVQNWQQWGHVFQVVTPDCPLYQQIRKRDCPPSQDGTGDVVEEALTILAVDDDPMTLLNLDRLLQASGKKVFTAENGEEALGVALDKQPDMIITDWRMPKVSGIELCKILRNTSITRHIYIIMLTGRESDDELVQAFDAGADDYVVKPFTPQVLEARIHSGERIIRYQQMINRDRQVIERYAARLASANRKLQTMAMTDALTELPNRRSALSRLKEVVAEAQRHREPLSCIMIDIDHFKEINDLYGHDVGDVVLKEIASIFSTEVRSYDMVSRLGGEEFLVICSRSNLQETACLADRLRQAVADYRVEINEASIGITISLGVAAYHEGMADGEEMTKWADRALYRAKQGGRNRVVVQEDGDTAHRGSTRTLCVAAGSTGRGQ